MPSLMAKYVIVLLCLVIGVQCKAEDLPLSFEEYCTLLNGHFDNIQQDDDITLGILEFKAKPVLIPGLQNGPVLYFEEAMNGNLFRRLVAVKNESSTSQRLDISYYNFTDPGQYKSGEFNTDDLANLTREDFRIDEGCHVSFVQLYPGAILGEAADCRHTVNGMHPVYTLDVTCDRIHFEPPLAAAETTSLMAYDLQHRGPRYPLINPSASYAHLCPDGM